MSDLFKDTKTQSFISNTELTKKDNDADKQNSQTTLQAPLQKPLLLKEGKGWLSKLHRGDINDDYDDDYDFFVLRLSSFVFSREQSYNFALTWIQLRPVTTESIRILPVIFLSVVRMP